MKLKIIYIYLSFLSLLFSTNNLKLVLTSGEILIGQSNSNITEEVYIINSDILGEISILKSNVKLFEVLKDIGNNEFEKLEISESANNSDIQKNEIKNIKNGPQVHLISDLYGKVKLLDAPKSWSGNLRIGMNLSFGDREYTHTYLRGKLKSKVRDSPHVFQLSGEYNFRETEQVDGSEYVSQDRYHLNFIYRWFYSDRWFFQNASSYRTDKLKGISNELQNILGLGYRSIFLDNLELLIGSGIGFQDRSILGITEESPLVMNIFQELNWNPTNRIKLNQTLNFFQSPDESDIYNYEFILGFNYRFTELLGFEIRYFIDFDSGISESIKKDSRFQNALIFYF